VIHAGGRDVLSQIGGLRAVQTSLRDRARHSMLALVAGQIATALVIAALIFGFAGGALAQAVLSGALIGIVPNHYLAGRLARRRPGAAPMESLRAIYTGELLKVAFAATLFVIAIELFGGAFTALVAGYAAMVAVNWLALLVLDLSETPRDQMMRAD
jgi:F0F1-type ATP synthase assembly protein I